MLPTLAKDFYLPPQQRHGTSVMLSIFCSVLLCFMALCKGSRLTGWADLDSLPVGACVCCWGDIKATGQPGTGPRGIVSQPQNTRTPRPQEDIMFRTRWQHMQRSHIQRIIITHSARLWWQLLLFRILRVFIRSILCSEQKADFHWHSQRVWASLCFCSSSCENGLCKSEMNMKFHSKPSSKTVITCTDRWME